MAYADIEVKRAKGRERYANNREHCKAISTAWRLKNRERHNALRHLIRLREMKNPQPRHIRKMAELCAKFPKRRINS